MKAQIDYRLPLLLIGGMLFQFLFWNEFLGLNLLLYSLFIFVITFSDKDIPYHKNKLYTALPHLAIAVYIVYNNSTLAVTTWFITLLVYLGTVHFFYLKSTVTALIWGSLQVLSGPFGIYTKLQQTKLGKVNFRPVIKPIKYIIVPLLLIIIFCTLYSTANPIFAKYVKLVTESVSQVFNQLFYAIFIDISIPKCLFVILGILITAGIIVGIKSKLLSEVELGEKDQLIRIRRDRKNISLFQDFRILLSGNQSAKKMALKTENVVGIICFIALNLLLMLLNGIDIFTLWFNNSGSNKNFSAELHDGTNTLIFSIVIAMLIIIYFFSGNINFYRKNKWIKLLAYVWIAQNTFLVASVFHRDYDYIFYYGLTYKRIGVAVFATLSLVGLVTVYTKVAQRKTIFYLYRLNAKVWYILLVALSFINWDTLIVNYNLAKADKIGVDVDHLMSFSDKTLPILNENRAFLLKHTLIQAENDRQTYNEAAAAIDTTATTLQTDTMAKPKLSVSELKVLRQKHAINHFNQRLDNKIEWFLEKQKAVSWLSYSYVERETAKNLSAKTNEQE